MNRVNLGTFKSRNHPSITDHLNQSRAAGWRETTAFLVVANVLAFGWLVWS